MRCYRPERTAQGERGGLVFFHAGGFVSGDPATHHLLCERLSLASGCIIVSSAYRLAPEHRFPSALDDAYFVACFVHEHADEFGIDHRRLGIAGVEVGASLATGVARLAKERRNPALALQLLIAPWLDLRGSSPTIQQYADPPQREDPRCSPAFARNLIGLPPAVLVFATEHPLAPQAEAYAAQLREAHVPVELVTGPGTASLLAEVPDSSEHGRAALRECGRAIERALAPRG